MTLIAGFHSDTNGLLLCADREEGVSMSKRSVDKIVRILGASSIFTIAGAGRSSVLMNAFQRLSKAISGVTDARTLYRDHIKIISGVLESIHKDFIWSREKDTTRQIQLIIGASFCDENPPVNFLYSTDEEILQVQPDYCAAGYGADMAHYFADRLYQDHRLTYPELLLLAAFIFREVGDAVREVGKGTDMIYISGNARTAQLIPHATLEKLEGQLPEFSDAVTHFWQDKAHVPSWLKEPVPPQLGGS